MLQQNWMRGVGRTLAAAVVTLGVGAVGGCSSGEGGGLVVRGGFGPAWFEIEVTPVPSCGQGGQFLGWTYFQGKPYRAYDLDGDGVADCVIDESGQSFAIQVISGDPDELVYYPSPELPAERPQARQPRVIGDFGLVKLNHVTWTHDVFASEFLRVHQFDPATSFIDFEIGVRPGTVLAMPGLYGLATAYESIEVGDESVDVYRIRGDAASAYWMIADSFAMPTFTIDTEVGAFEFAPEPESSTGGGEDEVEQADVRWMGLPAGQLSRPQGV